MWLHALRLNILKFETDKSDNSILYTKTPKFLFLRIFTCWKFLSPELASFADCLLIKLYKYHILPGYFFLSPQMTRKYM